MPRHAVVGRARRWASDEAPRRNRSCKPLNPELTMRVIMTTMASFLLAACAASPSGGPASAGGPIAWQQRLAAMPDQRGQARLASERVHSAWSELQDKYPWLGVGRAPSSFGRVLALRADRVALEFESNARIGSPGQIVAVYGDEGFKAEVYLAEVDGPYGLGQVAFLVPDRSVELADRFASRPATDWQGK